MDVSKSIELLAPAGNWECARAAVENGADAIYFGLDAGFNARARAANFHIDELDRLMKMLRRQAVRGYVTLNTLVFTDELSSLESNVRRLADAGVDAVLVQDLGVARLVRELCPDMILHASTQMTLTHAAAIEMARELGVQRVVLARELSISEIRKIASETTMPLEVFVHGALCVAYSGQCLTSESFGGRSANRGQCAQACRLPYELICDGQPEDLGAVKYLLSPQDLAAHDLVPQLIAAGVCSLKIEGRLKSPEYVANVCAQYRKAIDEALQQRPRVLTADQRRDLEMSFSRGFSPGWLEGCDHKRLVPGLNSAKRGVLLGQVEAVSGDTLTVQLQGPLAAGDGIVLEGDRFAGKEIGGRVYELFQVGKKIPSATHGTVRIGLQRDTLQSKGAAGRNLIGVQIWKTDDPQLTKRLRKSFAGPDPVKRVPFDLRVNVAVGQPVKLIASMADIGEIKLTSEHVCEAARKHACNEDLLRDQFSRLGGTAYRLETLGAEILGDPMVPLSVLGQLRHRLVELLDRTRMPVPLRCESGDVANRLISEAKAGSCAFLPTPARTDSETLSDSPNSACQLRVLCRTMQQLDQVLDAGVQRVIVDFHDIRQYRQAVESAHRKNAAIELATLRIHKPAEDGLFRALCKHPADGWLVRNLAAMDYCRKKQIPMSCDFSLNVTNPLTAQRLIQWGADRVTASYDLNREQLFELVDSTPSDWLEVVIHQHMPMFHMEHCVFCSVLSPGKNKSDCGRPCDLHDVQLRDRVGVPHVLHADIGCRNTLFNGIAQSGAEAVRPLIERGIRQFRIELLRNASDQEVETLLQLYRALLAGQLSGTEVWQKLRAHNRIGVTRGTLEQPRNPLAIL